MQKHRQSHPIQTQQVPHACDHAHHTSAAAARAGPQPYKAHHPPQLLAPQITHTHCPGITPSICKNYLPFCKKSQTGRSGIFGLYCVNRAGYTNPSRVDFRLHQGRCGRELSPGTISGSHAVFGLARMPFMKRISRKWLLALLPSFLHIAAAPARLGAG